MKNTDLFSFNGINGATGGYLTPEMTAADVSKIVRDEKFNKEHLQDLIDRYNKPDHLGPIAGIDPTNLAQAGWGIIFAFDDRDKVAARKESLKPLLDLRKEQAGEYYREYTGPDAYRSGESKNDFLGRHGRAPGPANPETIPYYLLIVADPETIPYRFQYQIDVQYAVGRIYFDTLEEYANYAQSVVQAEKGEYTRSAKATFFGVQNPADKATELSATELVQPLADWMAEDQPDWSVQTLLKDEAMKANLTELFNNPDGPALLFTASHGMGFPNGDIRQLPHQGALLCQDLPGMLKWRGKPVPEEHYFSADDVGTGAKLGGMINFHFACYGAGTPKQDEFAHKIERTDIAPHAFMARLPQRLLSHPKGGALAVISHVERAWGCSFMWKSSGRQLDIFKDLIKYLTAGYPVGYAVEEFNERYAELSTDLTNELNELQFGKIPNDMKLSRMWTSNNDARGYAIIGDPAVRLPTSATGMKMPKPPIRVQSGDVPLKPGDDWLDHTVTVTVSSQNGEIRKEKTWSGSMIIPSGADEAKKDEHLASLHRKVAAEAKKGWEEDRSVISTRQEEKE
ncbi:MAG: hypothetical protein D3917_11020 [Candidatus Electrothrix sp. AX5]|nr:hypothetical protein [Candidatus Electrothrix sp. AX5]